MTPRVASLRERVRLAAPLVGFVLLAALVAWLATSGIDDMWEMFVG